MSTHLQRFCPRTEVDCPHSEFGFCLDKFPRGLLRDHLEKQCLVVKSKGLIYRLKGERDELEGKVGDMGRENERLRNGKEEVERENERLKKEIEDLKNANNGLVSQVGDLKREKVNLNGQMDSLKKQNELLRLEVIAKVLWKQLFPLLSIASSLHIYIITE
jgi:predicted nuclease with TOPRIM domain